MELDDIFGAASTAKQRRPKHDKHNHHNNNNNNNASKPKVKAAAAAAQPKQTKKTTSEQKQRPGTAKGVVFITIEDETGIANCVVWAKTMERYRRVLMGARLILVQGRLQKHGSIIHVVVEHMEDRTEHLVRLAEGGIPKKAALARADEVVRPVTDPNRWRQNPQRHPRNVKIMPKSRDFH